MIAVVVFILVSLFFYYFYFRCYNYWQIRGVKHDRPIPIFGNTIERYFMKRNTLQIIGDYYRKYPNEKVIGFYNGRCPCLLIRDPEIIRSVLITDFQNFSARSYTENQQTTEMLMQNLLHTYGDVWKLLRQQLAPSFTIGKVKAMFPLITERAEKLIARTLVAAKANKPIDAFDLMARYTIDFIGACGFGMDADTLSDEDSPLRKLGKKCFTYDAWYGIITILKETFPDLFTKLRFLGYLEKDLIEMVELILKQRNYEPCGRNDFIDLLLECQKKGKIEGELTGRIKPDGTPERVELQFNNALIASQVFIFFAAGFETSATATSCTLLQLAFYPEEQKKVQDEVDRVLEKYKELSYEAIKEMTYLECALKEAMRIFPPAGYLRRDCVNDCVMSDVGIKLTKGVNVYVSLQAMQTDEKYFDNPNHFDPKRFLPENVQRNTKYTYLPFGGGPRICIGERLAIMQSVAVLAAVLSRFIVEPCERTPRKVKINPTSDVVQGIDGEIPLIFRERKLPTKTNI